jgi:hypothetical protein
MVCERIFNLNRDYEKTKSCQIKSFLVLHFRRARATARALQRSFMPFWNCLKEKLTSTKKKQRKVWESSEDQEDEQSGVSGGRVASEERKLAEEGVTASVRWKSQLT